MRHEEEARSEEEFGVNVILSGSPSIEDSPGRGEEIRSRSATIEDSPGRGGEEILSGSATIEDSPGREIPAGFSSPTDFSSFYRQEEERQKEERRLKERP
eukprot:424146-Pyramimonas_sp.AAC.1